MQTWQARALTAAEGKTFSVLLSALVHAFDKDLVPIMNAVFPGLALGLREIAAPYLVSTGTVWKDGSVRANYVSKDGTLYLNAPFYVTATELQDDFRRLGDALKFDDPDREQLFNAVKNWLTADRRLDPTFDPKDPDARRLLN